MFVEIKDLLGLIINVGRQGELLDTKWKETSQVIPCVMIYYDEEQKDFLTGLNSMNIFPVQYQGGFLGGFSRTINHALNHITVPKSNLSFVTPNVMDLQHFAEPLGTILISSAELSEKHMGFIPDFKVDDINEVLEIIHGQNKGYFAETFSTILDSGHSLSTSGIILTYELPLINDRYLTVFSCGRYYQPLHPRSVAHQLSNRILNCKWTGYQNNLFANILRPVVDLISTNATPVDGITRVPPRPSSDRDRLGEIVKLICSESSIVDMSSTLRCIRDYPTQKGLNSEQRKNNIKGVFRSDKAVEGKSVILFDDVITTGATVLECAETLLSAGAREVIVMTIAVNQMIPVWRSQVVLPCRHCSSAMKLRFNRSNNKGFFGCSSYPDCKSTLTYAQGWTQYIEQNSQSCGSIILEEDIEF